MSGVGPSSAEEQRVGRRVGALLDGVAIHQRVAAVGHSEPQRAAGTVLRRSGRSQSRRSPALPARRRQGTRAAQEVPLSLLVPLKLPSWKTAYVLK